MGHTARTVRATPHTSSHPAGYGRWLLLFLMIEPSRTAPDLPSRFVLGRASVHRVGRWGLTKFELIQDGNVLAQLGRTGWFRIYMGPGQWITIADGEQWRVRAIGTRGSLIPAVFDSNGRRIAMAGSSHGTYGITGRDFACSLYPAEKPSFSRANGWILRQFEDELATITRYPLSIEAKVPVHLGAVFLSFILVRHGLPDDSKPGIPSFRWS